MEQESVQTACTMENFTKFSDQQFRLCAPDYQMVGKVTKHLLPDGDWSTLFPNSTLAWCGETLIRKWRNIIDLVTKGGFAT